MIPMPCLHRRLDQEVDLVYSEATLLPSSIGVNNGRYTLVCRIKLSVPRNALSPNDSTLDRCAVNYDPLNIQ